jgi:WD40 repeat protein
MLKTTFLLNFCILLVFCGGVFAQNGNISGNSPRDTIRLFDKTGDLSKTPVITCLDISKDGKLLAVGGDDHIVRIWNFEKKKFVWESQPYDDWVRGLSFNFDHSLLVTAAQSGQVCLWSVSSAEESARLLQTLEIPQGIQKIVFHPKENQFAVCGFEKAVRVFEVNNQLIIQQKQQLETPATANRSISYSPDGKFLVTGGRNGVVRLWQTDADWKYTDIENVDKRRINALVFSPDSGKLAVGGDGPFITLWDTKTKKQVEPALKRDYGKTFSLAFCNENILASGESDNVIRVWDIKKAEITGEYAGHQGTIASMICADNAAADTAASSAANVRLISGSFDTTIRFWNVDVAGTEIIEKTAAAVPVFAIPELPVAK